MSETPAMTTAEFLGAVALLRWAPSTVSLWCGYSRQAGTAWASGRAAVPWQVAAWLDARLAGHLMDPPER